MKEKLSATLENSKGYTLKVAEAMPEEGYSFKPKGAGWGFEELLPEKEARRPYNGNWSRRTISWLL